MPLEPYFVKTAHVTLNFKAETKRTCNCSVSVVLCCEEANRTTNPSKMRFFQMAAQPMMMGQMPIVILGGKPYMLQACDGADVYCNALDGFEPLSEGADGPHAWPAPYMVDVNTTDDWLNAVGRGIY